MLRSISFPSPYPCALLALAASSPSSPFPLPSPTFPNPSVFPPAPPCCIACPNRVFSLAVTPCEFGVSDDVDFGIVVGCAV
ncbi:hypothetical protein M011DRAFT_469111, partial [Sporormia fimetaria CBS 119925]